MRLKVRCPDCGETHLLRPECARRLMSCPSCRYDFVPAADVVLPCPRCGSIITSGRQHDDHKLSCLECRFVLPEPKGTKWQRLRRRMRWLLRGALLSPFLRHS